MKIERWRRKIKYLNAKCISTGMSEEEYLRKRAKIFEIEKILKVKEMYAELGIKAIYTDTKNK